MEVFVSTLDKNLRYITHEIIDNELYIYVESKRDEVKCRKHQTHFSKSS